MLMPVLSTRGARSSSTNWQRDLQTLDDATLAEMEIRTRAAPAFEPAARGKEPEGETGDAALSRRQFLRTTLGLGVVGTVACAGVGYVAWETGGLRQKTQTELALGAEIIKLRGLLLLYEALEQVGLDGIVATGLLAVNDILSLLEAGSQTLRMGLERLEQVVLGLKDAGKTLADAVSWVEDRVTGVAGLLQQLENALGDAFEPAAPVAERVVALADRVLNLLPFGAGQSIRQGLSAMADTLSAIPEMILAVNDRLLDPLKSQWLASDPDQGLLARLGLVSQQAIFDPLEAHLADLEALSARWQQALALPVKAALDERSGLRDDILRYRDENSLSPTPQSPTPRSQ